MGARASLATLKHAIKHPVCDQVKKVREPHPDIGCWWTLYDYGLEAVKKWDKEYKHPYPGESHPTYLRKKCCESDCSMHAETVCSRAQPEVFVMTCERVCRGGHEGKG